MSAKISQFCHSDGLVYWGECCFQTHIAALRRNLHDWEIWKEIRGTTRVLAILDFIFCDILVGSFQVFGCPVCVFEFFVVSPWKIQNGRMKLFKISDTKISKYVLLTSSLIQPYYQTRATIFSLQKCPMHQTVFLLKEEQTCCFQCLIFTSLFASIFYWIGQCWIFQ